MKFFIQLLTLVTLLIAIYFQSKKNTDHTKVAGLLWVSLVLMSTANIIE